MISSFRGKYRFLSNFYPSGTSTLEHLYQAAKTFDPSECQAILSACTPGEAKRLGRKVQYHRADWKSAKVGIMTDLVWEKFLDPTLRELLLSTGDEELIEGNTWGDTFWGVDMRTGEGLNHLGKILMETRRIIREGEIKCLSI